MEIQFEHEHFLTFCEENKENFSHTLLKFSKRVERHGRILELDDDDDEGYSKCRVCFKIVDDGPVNFCEVCDDIWGVQQTDEISDSELPFFNYKKHTCDGCRDYECAECGLKLDSKCAVSPDNAGRRQITTSLSPDTKTQIYHDSHDHKLFLFNSRKDLFLVLYCNCELCKRKLVDLTYGCFGCCFYHHKRCAEISQQECLHHPCHSHHPLSTEYDCGKFQLCSVQRFLQWHFNGNLQRIQLQN